MRDRTPGMALMTTLGLGRLRPAPGTWGSLPPVAIAVALSAAGIAPASIWFGAAMAVVCGVFAGACVRFGDEAEALLGDKDPSSVVADETSGMALVLMFMPASGASSPEVWTFTLGLAFVAFRVFDVFKPWPCSAVQRVPGGWGILLDDLFAAAYTLIVLHVAALVL